MIKVNRNIQNLFREYAQFFYNKRTFVFFILFAFLLHNYLAPVSDFTVASKNKVTPWVVLFLFSSVYFGFIFLLGAVYLFSKVPFLERWEMYQQIRYGKIRWTLVQIGKIFLSSLSYVLMTLLLSIIMLFPNISLEKGWGKILYTMALTDAASEYSTVFSISYQMINENKLPLKVMGKSILVLGLIVSVVGLLMFFLSICFSRMAAIIITIICSLLPIVIEEMKGGVQQIFVLYAPTEWIKLYKIGNSYQNIQSLNWNQIVIRLSLYSLILGILILYRIIRMEFNWYSEE